MASVIWILSVVLYAEFMCAVSVYEFLSMDCQHENHGVLGKDSLLKCFLNTRGDSVRLISASWWRPGGKRPLIIFRNNEVLEPEDPRFSFKQLPMSDSNIDVSFLVRNTVRTDEGEYECVVETDSGDIVVYTKAVSLSVTATYSKPDMSSVPEKDLQEGMEVTLFCNASGAYPVAMIRWYDQHDTDWTRSAEMTVVETTDKRTNLSSKVTLKASSIAPQYRCLVLNNNGVEEGKAEFDLKFRENEFLSLDCQDEKFGHLGKESLLKCFLNSGGINVTVTAATWRRPGEKRPLIKFINDKVSVREDPRFAFKQLQMSGSNIDVSFLVRKTFWTDKGKYECQVQTDSGYAKAVVSLSVTGEWRCLEEPVCHWGRTSEGVPCRQYRNDGVHYYDNGFSCRRRREWDEGLSPWELRLRGDGVVIPDPPRQPGRSGPRELISLDCQDENHGVHGKDSLLKCFLNSGGESVKVTSATWRRPGEYPPLIMFINDTVGRLADPRFAFKQLQMSGSNIDVSFLVRNTVRTDEGKYECVVVTDSGEDTAVVSLSVTATYSKPDMSSVPEKGLQEGMEVTLFCNASGGYPVGMIHWYDQHGTNWTRSAEMTVVETTDKRTNLSSKFTLGASSSAPLYRCLVLNNNGVEEGKAEFALKFQEKEGVMGDQGSTGSMSSTASTAVLVFVIVGSLLYGLLILALLHRQRIQRAMYPEGSDMMEEGFLKKGVQAMQWITISSCSTSSAGLNNGRSMELIPPVF